MTRRRTRRTKQSPLSLLLGLALVLGLIFVFYELDLLPDESPAAEAPTAAAPIPGGIRTAQPGVSGEGELWAVYFTDPLNKKVWYVSPQGKKRVVDEGIERPNGLILWPDQGTLVVADTLGPYLWTFRVEPDGSLSHKQPYYTLRMVPGQMGSGADGMTVDAFGRLYVATHAGLQVFDPTGRMSGVILKPQNKFLSNVAFGGPNLGTLYVTCSDKVYRRPTKVRGVRYHKAPGEKPR